VHKLEMSNELNTTGCSLYDARDVSINKYKNSSHVADNSGLFNLDIQ